MAISRSRVVRKLIHLPVVGRHLQRAHDSWLSQYLRASYGARNWSARRALAHHQPELTAVQQAAVQSLREHGFAAVHCSDLLKDPSLWQAIERDVHAWVDEPEHAARVAAYTNGSLDAAAGKPYEIKRYSDKPVLGPDHLFLRFGVQHELLDIVNSYLGVMAQLLHVDAWHTIPRGRETQRIKSQNWHRDPEDFRLVKVFCYLTDVDEASGALEYIRGSRKGERYGSIAPQATPYGNRPDPDVVDAEVAPADRVVCAFPAGTFVFADTTGLHRGGHAKTKERLLTTWEYVTPASWYDRHFRVDDVASDRSLSTAQAHALAW